MNSDYELWEKEINKKHPYLNKIDIFKFEGPIFEYHFDNELREYLIEKSLIKKRFNDFEIKSTTFKRKENEFEYENVCNVKIYYECCKYESKFIFTELYNYGEFDVIYHIYMNEKEVEIFNIDKLPMLIQELFKDLYIIIKNYYLNSKRFRLRNILNTYNINTPGYIENVFGKK